MAYRAKLNSLQLDHMMHKTNFKKIIFFRPQLVCTKNKLKLILVISKFDSITTTNQHNINYQQPCDNLLYVKLTQKEKKPMLKQSKFKCNTTQLKYQTFDNSKHDQLANSKNLSHVAQNKIHTKPCGIMELA